MVVTCTAVGGTDPVSYQWSSTCRYCPFMNANSNSVAQEVVDSDDTGIHTCTAISGSLSGSETIHFNVVGKPSKAIIQEKRIHTCMVQFC